MRGRCGYAPVTAVLTLWLLFMSLVAVVKEMDENHVFLFRVEH